MRDFSSFFERYGWPSNKGSLPFCIGHRGASGHERENTLEAFQRAAEVLPSAMFRVTLTNGHVLLTTMAGKMRKFRIRILAGDHVTVEMSPYDLTRGRITFRHKLERTPIGGANR